jgi:hypothetical protein
MKINDIATSRQRNPIWRTHIAINMQMKHDFERSFLHISWAWFQFKWNKIRWFPTLILVFLPRKRFNKVIAIIRRKYGEISGFVEFTRNIYTTQGAENKSENVLFHFAFPRGPFMVYFVASSRHRTRNLS